MQNLSRFLRRWGWDIVLGISTTCRKSSHSIRRITPRALGEILYLIHSVTDKRQRAAQLGLVARKHTKKGGLIGTFLHTAHLVSVPSSKKKRATIENDS